MPAQQVDPFSRRLLAQYDALYPGGSRFSGGSGSSGLYRGMQLWASAVTGKIDVSTRAAAALWAMEHTVVQVS